MATGFELDFEKLKSNEHVTIYIGSPEKVLNVEAPTAAELNSLESASEAISWNDLAFGIEASETQNDPSLADVSNYETRGAANYGGSMSFYYPEDYEDLTNRLAVIHELTRVPGTFLLVAIRVDGEKRVNTPWATGDYAHVFLVQTDSEANSIQGADALRRTVGMLQQSVFSVYTVVGDHTLVADQPTVAATAGDKGRVTVKANGREFTNALTFTSSAPAIATVEKGGVWKAVATGEATLTATDPRTGTSVSIVVTVA